MFGLSTRAAFVLVPVSVALSLPLLLKSGPTAPEAPVAPTFGEILAVHAPTLTDYKPEGVSTRANGVRPLAVQRGTSMEGSIRAAAGYPIAFGGSRTQRTWSGKTTLNGVDLRTGSFVASDRDISLPGEGITVPVSRTYNGQQSDGSARFDSAGLQGNNWFQGSLPEIQLWEHASDDALDMVYLNYGADRFVEFKRTGASDDEFQGKQGTGGYLVYTEDTGTGPDLYVYTDTNGTAWTFFGEDADSGDAAGQLWKVTDAAGNTTYVHSSSDAEDTADNGFSSTAKGPLKVYDAEDRRYSFTYTSGQLTEVKVETKTGGTWAGTPTGLETVAEVDYTYLSSAGTHGQVDDLQLVTKTTPLSDGSLTSTQYYRYWRDSDSKGDDHLVKLVLSPEGWRRYEGSDGNFTDNDYLTASDNDLKPYASHYFEYDSSGRIIKAVFGGDCGCGGGGIGEYNFTYTTNSDYAGVATDNYDTIWKDRTVVEQPDGTYLTQYFDEVGQPLSQVITDANPTAFTVLDPVGGSTDFWATEVVRNSGGIVTAVHTPANITGYVHANGDVAFTRDASSGLIYSYSINSSGGLRGFVEHKKWQEGTSPTPSQPILLESYTYTSAMVSGTNGEAVHPLIASVRRYYDEVTSGTMGSTLTSYAYSYHSGSTMVETVTQTNPVVTTGNHGSNSATVSYRYLDEQGREVWTKSEDGAISYSEYVNGVMTKQIRDADTTQTGAGEDFNGVSVPSSPVSFASSGSPLHQKTSYSYDAQGRRETTTLPTGRVTGSYWSQSSDRMVVSLNYPKVVSGSPTVYHGPVGVRVTNQAGKAEASGQIELTNNTSNATQSTHVDTAEPSDELDDVLADLGDLCRLTTTQYDESGSQASSVRLYHLIPATLTTAVEGTNYDTTSYAYDSMGRKIRTLEPSGTIRRVVYDARGRVASNWVGTDDTGLEGGMTGGTDNTVQTNAIEYDGGSDGGNGHVTKRTAYVVDGTTDQRITNYTYDARGRLLLQENPQAPHILHSYDNLGRRLATAQYSGVSNITVGTTDPAATGTATDRLALRRSYYDAMGRVWKSTRHEIDAADGSDDANLETLNWYDEEGRLIKTEGSTLSKTRYDGLGRATHRFTLAVDNDSGYSDADDVSGDIVLQEDQTVYDGATGLVLMRVRIDRHHDDYSTVPANETTGELDTNADGDALLVTAANLEGRAQITGFWYDSLDRMEDTVRFGTYGGGNFDRDGMSVPARSATALRTTNSYGIDGAVQDVTDPRDLVRRTEHDHAGRVTKTIRNYVNGTPTGDTDATVSYAYTDGLRTSITAETPAGQDNQTTTYTYGTTGGGSTGNSDIATGHLLQKVAYPDSSSGTDVVTFAYNAQGQQVYKKDQAGNVIETVYDTGGRATERKATTVASGFDADVKRIETAYDDLGRRESVTQYDSDSSGNATDGVAFTYGGWGQLTEYEEDRNGVVSSGGDEYDIVYTWETATGGRNTLRRNETTLPSGTVMDYDYRNAAGRHDSEVSRVTSIDLGSKLVVSYAYSGVGQVVETDYPEPDARSRRHGATSGDYEDWDRFNRITSDDWTAYSGTATNFYDIDIAYDENSNITLIEDNVHSGFDVDYTMDDLDRLTRAEEGTWGGSSITTTSRDQEWVLDQVGNWDEDKLDLDGDGLYTGTDEHHDARTHNKVNELTARDTNNNGTNDFTLSYDAAGNLTDDGESYKYEYDAFYRLRYVKDQSNNVVAEHRYNGLGHRIGEHVDTDDDGDVDGSDEWRYFAYDERWRIVAHFLGSDSAPTEEFVHHAAGLDGGGGSSYIDLVALRERDTDDNGSREERMYYCQNWRADVSAIIDSNGEMYEWVKYSAYGVPFGLPGADTDSDGDCDSTDITQIQSWIDPIYTYDARGDVDLDGDVDSADKSDAQSRLEGQSSGRMALSVLGNQLGYSGYRLSGDLPGSYAVRNRVMDSRLGMWLARDSAEYRDSLVLASYSAGNPLAHVDPLGRSITTPGGVVLPAPGSGGAVNQPPEWVWSEGTGDCCERIQALVPAGWPGATACCDGIPVACTFNPNPNDNKPGAQTAWQIVKECAGPHEAVHKRYCRCNPNAPNVNGISKCDKSGYTDEERRRHCDEADQASEDCLRDRLDNNDCASPPAGQTGPPTAEEHQGCEDRLKWSIDLHPTHRDDNGNSDCD